MTYMPDINLIRQVAYVERKTGPRRVERDRGKEKRDKGREGPHKFKKELENRQTANRIDITV
jgi:hypothetical protein